MAKSQDCLFLPPPRILTHGRFLVLILGLLALTANSMADVNYDTTTHTFTGSGTYDQAVNETVDVTATPTDGATITFTGNVTTTGTFIHNGAHVIFDAGTTNSFGIYRLYNRTIDNTHYVNDSSMTLNGNLTVTDFQAAGRVNNYSGTSKIYINEGSSLNVSGVFSIAEANKAQGIIDQNGGTVSITTSGDTDVRIGHWFNKNYPTKYNLKNGVLNIPNTVAHVGWDAYAELNISGGEANLKGINLSAGGKTVDGVLGGKGFLNLTGGTLNLGSEGVTYIKKKDGASYNTDTAPEINLGNGTISASESHTWASNLTITLTAGKTPTFDIDANKTITIASVVKGDGGLKKTGAGILKLTNANTYTGETIVQNGVLMLTKGGSSGSLYKGTTVTVNGSTAVLAGDGDVFSYGANSVGRINLNNGGTLTNDSSTGHITVGAVIYMNNGKINTTDPTAAGSDASGNFVFDNAIYVTAGTNNEISVQKFAIRHLNNTPYASGDDGGVFDVDQSAQLTISSIIIDKATTSGTKVPLVKRGAGTLTLSGANTYTEETTVSEGVLELTGSAVVANGPISVGANGTLEYNLANGQTERLTIEDTNAILSTGTIKKTGEGTLKLFAADEDLINSHSFVVSSGRLDMTKYFKGALTVGEKLDPENYLTAIFSPGNSVGSLEITGDFTLNPGSTLLLEFDETGADSLLVSGTTKFEEGAIITLALDEGASPVPNQQVSFQLPANIATFDNAALSYPSYLVGIGYDPTTGVLSATVDANAVPEPSTWALLLLGAAGLMYVRKRTRK